MNTKLIHILSRWAQSFKLSHKRQWSINADNDGIRINLDCVFATQSCSISQFVTYEMVLTMDFDILEKVVNDMIRTLDESIAKSAHG